MYKMTVIRGFDHKKMKSYILPYPPTESEQERLLSYFIAKCYIDICRLQDDGLSDTANFRHVVEADLEPLTLETK